MPKKPKWHRPKPLSPDETLALMKRVAASGSSDLASKIHRQAVEIYIGTPYGDRQCPLLLPQDPNIPRDQRKRCVRWGPHADHSDTYLIEEQTLG